MNFIIMIHGDKPLIKATIATDDKRQAVLLTKLLLASGKWTSVDIKHKTRMLTLQELEAL